MMPALIGNQPCVPEYAVHKWEARSEWLRTCKDGVALVLREPVLGFSRNSVTKEYLSQLNGGSCRVVLHQRHPFDTLVSLYSSFTKNHPVPGGMSKEDAQRFMEERK